MALDASLTDYAPTFVAVATVEQVPPGWVLKVKAGHRVLAIANCEGTIYALENSCSHSGGPLGDNRLQHGCMLECPWHDAMFDVRTGEALRGPARKPQRTYPVRVDDGTILVALD